MNWDYMNANYNGEDWVGFKVRDFLMTIVSREPVNKTEYECHQSRPVLLPTGWADRPYPWHPEVIELGIYKIGNFYILSVPGEFSTMAGRIIREKIRQVIRQYTPEFGSPEAGMLILYWLILTVITTSKPVLYVKIFVRHIRSYYYNSWTFEFVHSLHCYSGRI